VSADAGRFEWAGRGQSLPEMLDGLFAQRSNLVSPSFLLMLAEMQRFNRTGRIDRAADQIGQCSLRDYLARRGYSERLVQDYLLPIGAAIWSTPVEQMLDFPAENFLAFFENHRLLHWERPTWRTVRGGSERYVEKLTARFRNRLRLGTSVVSIARTPDSVIVVDGSGHRDSYDHVVIAAHSDQALLMLADASAAERAILGAIPYRENTVFLHRDPRLMPKRRRAWASWNFLRAGGGSGAGSAGNDVAVTYWMNALQNIDRRLPLFVSLNPPVAPSPDLTFARYTCEHPQYDRSAFAAQNLLAAIQGIHRTWFCGAWTGYGFHEDGLRSGLAVAKALGATIPWHAPLAADLRPLLRPDLTIAQGPENHPKSKTWAASL
jgi:predicted NAD/FAD-binding protein